MRCPFVYVPLGFVPSAAIFAAEPAPTQLSWGSRQLFDHPFADGSRIVFRRRFALIGTLIQHGPESCYFGVAGSPSIDWGNASDTRSIFAGIGGGFGFIDSRGIGDGQGQDFTLTSFMQGGIGHVTASERRAHVSTPVKRGMIDPNPGIDALGFTLGYSWRP